VKLDRSLLANLDDPRQTLVVERTIELLTELGFLVVVEGVTAEDEGVVLAKAGATHLQGYLFGMPEDHDTIVSRVRQHGLAALVPVVSG
jgi:EAL domain-containing protein (putative c-di-GMP-specific phosphodiesterase class I)